jgi:hypothetical protein
MGYGWLWVIVHLYQVHPGTVAKSPDLCGAWAAPDLATILGRGTEFPMVKPPDFWWLNGTFNGDSHGNTRFRKIFYLGTMGCITNQLVIKHGSVGHRKGGFLLGVFHCHVWLLEGAQVYQVQSISPYAPWFLVSYPHLSHIFVEPVLKNTWSLWASNLDHQAQVKASSSRDPAQFEAPCSSRFWDCVQGSLGNRHHAWPRCTGSYTQLPASLPAVELKRRRFGDTHDERYGFTHWHGHPRIESIYPSIHPSIHVGTVCGYCI